MSAYDLHVYTSHTIGENSLEEMASFAKRLGFLGIGVVRFHTDPKKELPKTDIDLVDVVLIKADKNIEEIASSIRKEAEIIAVYGGNYEINRQACESKYVDILFHPEFGRNDSGLDHICARAAHDSNTAIEINVREIIESYKKGRTRVLLSMKRNIMLCKKYGTNIITTSSALSKWNMRSGRELASISYLLGLELGNAIDTVGKIPEEIVKINREKLMQKRFEGVIEE
ncbi:MAG: hypothetical protein HY831_05060 [Candidatus Aenigmarchaeota archaeon]|nr:hypothetical protein [Candidatus Aenigmarchaeota archaeon]